MCGFAGVFGDSVGESREALLAMGYAIRHRGPDDEGIWIGAGQIGLVHRRLSVVDVSPLGHQPMKSPSGRFQMVFNGEIYNHQKLRLELEKYGAKFRGHSDTEVALAAFDEWGIEGALKQFNGMFAFAIWDVSEKKLFLARDRIGEKPLYYGWQGKYFLFGSELKALTAFTKFRARLDRKALSEYLRLNYVPNPLSIYEGIYKVPPATWLVVEPGRVGEVSEPHEYWSLEKIIEDVRKDRLLDDEKAAADSLDALLREAVAMRMEADVPLGAFLSGGVDSSMVVALMQAQSERAVRTFSIGFQDSSFNEAIYAKAVAEHLGTDHTEFYVTPKDALDVIPLLPDLYDEPFGDVSQIPTYLVAKAAREHVTVALSGDAGDEVFGGYNRYFMGRSFWKRYGWIPAPLRTVGAHVLSAMLSPRWCDMMSNIARQYGKGGPKTGTLCDKADKVTKLLSVRNADDLYRELVSFWREDDALLRGPVNVPDRIAEMGAGLAIDDIGERMMYMDMLTYLPDDILVKVDRATMGVSLEGRIPFLDHRVIEFSWGLPVGRKLYGSGGKKILKNVLFRYIPESLIERPKMGFSMPIGQWLRHELRDWAESLLDEKRLRQEGFFRPETIRRAWHDHLSGKRNLPDKMWNVLMFQAWLERWGSSISV